MFVKCPNCGLQTLARDFCDHCRYRLPSAAQSAPDLQERWPPTAAAPPPPEADEAIPVVLPAAPVSSRFPGPAEPPDAPSQRVFARRAEPAPPKRLWPWILGAVGGVILFGCLAVGVAEMVARSTGTSLFGGAPAPTPANVATPKDVNADEVALTKAKAPPLSPDTIEEMLKLADAKGRETLVDLGCGNGRLAVQAAEKGLFVFAYDNDPILVKMGRRLLADRPHLGPQTIKIDLRDNILQTDLRAADIIIVAHPDRWGGAGAVGKQLKPHFTKEGARLVSTQPIFASFAVAAKTVPFEPPDDPGRKYTLFLYTTPLLVRD